MPGRFITIEGGEGVGKSAFVKMLSAKLGDLGHNIYLTREPGGTPTANKIRALFSEAAPGDPFCPETEAFLVNAARAQHVEKIIRPKIAGNEWVLCDRYADSTLVYQGVLGNLERNFLDQLIELATGGLTPEVTFVLDCDISIAMERCQGRGQEEEAIRRFDEAGRETHAKIRQAFLDLAQEFTKRICVLDASLPLEDVVGAGMSALEERGFV